MRVLLADDHNLFLEGLASLLIANGVDVVGTAKDGLDALEQTRELRPDIIVMDVQMPRCDGLTATRLIKAEMPEIKIVMLTMSETDSLLVEALKSGASGFLLKNLDSANFLNTLQDVYRGKVSPSMDFPGYTHIHQELSSRQIQILTLVASGLTYKEIAGVLNLSERTIKYHMGETIAKLQVDGRSEAIALARQVGLTTKV